MTESVRESVQKQATEPVSNNPLVGIVNMYKFADNVPPVVPADTNVQLALVFFILISSFVWFGAKKYW